MGLVEDIGPGPVALDTVGFIYFIEEEPRFLPVLLPLFTEADRGQRTIVTSALTLHEVLVVPFRAGQRQLADRYEQLLTMSRGVRLIDITRAHLRAAAQLRASSGMKTPDALHLVSAIGSQCRYFITNDRRLPSIRGLNVIQLSAYLA